MFVFWTSYLVVLILSANPQTPGGSHLSLSAEVTHGRPRGANAVSI
jgi:hypothetical protein